MQQQTFFTAMPRGAAVQHFDGQKSIVISDSGPVEECIVAQVYDNFLNGHNRIYEHAALILHAANLETTLRKAVDSWPAFDSNAPAVVADLAAWFGNYLTEVQSVLDAIKASAVQACTDDGIEGLQATSESNDEGVLPPPNKMRSSGGEQVIVVTDQRHATILAALRHYQQCGMGIPENRSDAIEDLASNGGAVVALNTAEIDGLCQDINQTLRLADVCQQREGFNIPIEVGNWDARRYGGMTEGGTLMAMTIADTRLTSGQARVGIVPSPTGPSPDVLVEVTRLPGTEKDVPCFHLSLNADALGASCYWDDNQFIVRPESGVTLEPMMLADQTAAFVLKATDSIED